MSWLARSTRNGQTPSSDEDYVIWSKAPEHLLTGLWWQQVLQYTCLSVNYTLKHFLIWCHHWQYDIAVWKTKLFSGLLNLRKVWDKISTWVKGILCRICRWLLVNTPFKGAARKKDEPHPQVLQWVGQKWLLRGIIFCVLFYLWIIFVIWEYIVFSPEKSCIL